MNPDLERWLNEGLAEAVAGVPEPPPAPAAAQGPKRNTKHGGVVRSTTTRVLSGQIANPVANPKAPAQAARPVKTVAPPTPEEELKAENPALAIPSMMTGMDYDSRKNGARPNPNSFVESAPNPTPEVAEAPLSWATTLKDLYDRTVRRGGLYHVGNSMVVVSVQKLKPRALSVPEH